MNNIELNNKVKQLVESNRFEKGIVSPIDILLQIGYLSKKDIDDWRFGRIEYLEKVCSVNLAKLTLINKSIKSHSKTIGLESSLTEYYQYGKRVKKKLRFSISGKKNIEETYSTHYLDKKRITEIKQMKSRM